MKPAFRAILFIGLIVAIFSACDETGGGGGGGDGSGGSGGGDGSSGSSGGAFAGTYSGDIELTPEVGGVTGMFSVTVDGAGNMSGSGGRSGAGMFTIGGSIDGSSDFEATTSAGDTWDGSVNSAGQFAGTWESQDGMESGVLNGSKAGGFTGTYSGTYSGSESGTFTLDIDVNGTVFGDNVGEAFDLLNGGRIPFPFRLTGGVDSAGNVSMGSRGRRSDGLIVSVLDGARWTGVVESNGRISGSWSVPDGWLNAGASGTYEGMR